MTSTPQQFARWLTLLAFASTSCLLPGCAETVAQQPYSPTVTYPRGVSTGKAGFVLSPYDPHYIVDVRGMTAGGLCRDKETGGIFRIPANAFAESKVADNAGGTSAPSRSNLSGPGWGAVILGVAVGAMLLSASQSEKSGDSDDSDANDYDSIVAKQHKALNSWDPLVQP